MSGLLPRALAAVPIVLWLLAPAGPGLAAPAPALPGQGHVTVLVLDMSGSMQANDPDLLTCAAASAYIELSQPGEMVGLVGLVHSRQDGAGAGGLQAAETWAPPTATDAPGRRALHQVVAQRCHPDPNGSTPTYDAIAKAYGQLSAAIGATGTPGSVLLLTDGLPYPDSDAQKKGLDGLLPSFAARRWRIDTVGIASSAGDLGFLDGVARSTDGTPYAATRGDATTALNLVALFVQIFESEVGRTPVERVPETALDGARTLEIDVNPYADSLDVIVAYDTAGTAVTLRNPQGKEVPPVQGTEPAARRFVTFYSIQQPVPSEAGPSLMPWTLTVTGSGRFLVDSLVSSHLAIAVTSSSAAVQALGVPFTVRARVVNRDGSANRGRFTLLGTLTYVGGGGRYGPQALTLSPTGTGEAQATATVPVPAPTGSYQLVLLAAETSAATPVAALTLPLRFGRFPYPYLCDPKVRCTDGPAGATALRWPGPLEALYSRPAVDRLAAWPLQGYPATPTAVTPALMKTADGALYGKPTRLRWDVSQAGSQLPFSSAAAAGRDGRVEVAFPAPAAGDYRLTFRSQGVRADSGDDFATSERSVHVAVGDASPSQVAFAAFATAAYLVALLGYLAYLRFCAAGPRFGGVDEVGGIGRHVTFGTVRRRLDRALRWPAWLSSGEAALPRGLQFRFRRLGGLEVRRRGRGSERWQADGLHGGFAGGIQRLTHTAYDGVVRTFVVRTTAAHDLRGGHGCLGAGLGLLGAVLVVAAVWRMDARLGLAAALVAPLTLRKVRFGPARKEEEDIDGSR